ncbi:tetratricopeptide repeat protein [Epibacterium ulvae]|uniref:tetratricopeptide repeat protein n=1 Tax=Epibacterium ulvae TaxID=1156985 RepID=UPI003CD0DFA6
MKKTLRSMINDERSQAFYKSIALSALLILAPMSGFAQDKPADQLLQQLATANALEAADLDRDLQAIWRRSGSAAMDLLLRRGERALEQQAPAEAIEHLTALVDHAPEFAIARLRRAEAFARLDQFGPAVADLEQALYLNPDDYNALFVLGQILEQFRDPEKAYEAYTRAKAIHPHHEAVTNALKRLAPFTEGRKL